MPDIRPGLIPLLAVAFSLVNSWHCSMMCGALNLGQKKSEFHGFLMWRAMGYTSMGALLGLFGREVLRSLEFHFSQGLAVLIFSSLTVFLVLPRVLSRWKWPRRLKSPAWRGLLMSLLPCHLLATYYALAILSGSPWVGALLLGAHAVATTPSLAYAWKWAGLLKKLPAWSRYALRTTLVALVFINLFYYSQKALTAQNEAAGQSTHSLCP